MYLRSYFLFDLELGVNLLPAMYSMHVAVCAIYTIHVAAPISAGELLLMLHFNMKFIPFVRPFYGFED